MIKKTPDVKKYTYRVSWSEDDQEHVGLCAEFPSLSHLSDTEQGALAGIVALVRDVVADMAKHGEEVPEPIATRNYSGRFQVRVPPAVHRRLVTEAREQNVSLNRLVQAKLAAS